MSAPTPSASERALAMFALVVAGEMIFCLPFHLPRYFRPSVLETFGLSNADLGDVFALYGLCAMLSYFPGGLLADRYPARGLMAFSLLATAAGGLVLLGLPERSSLALLYGWWGMTTILLFWAAMIRATRDWGGSASQGRAFGFLDGGRGLCAAAFASAAVLVFSLLVPELDAELSDEARVRAMRGVIAFYTGATVLAALLVWLLLPRQAVRREAGSRPAWKVLRQPGLWLLAIVVVCAYCGYKGLDNYALYVHEVLGYSEAGAAAFTASSAYLRPLGAVAAGLIADRISARLTLLFLFVTAFVCYAALAVLGVSAGTTTLIMANLLISFLAVFAMRGVYFAAIAECRIPSAATGISVGIVSVVGYTPDIFFAPIAGRLLDASPGLTGHQHYFILLAGIAIVGLVTVAILSLALRGGSQLQTRGTVR